MLFRNEDDLLAHFCDLSLDAHCQRILLWCLIELEVVVVVIRTHLLVEVFLGPLEGAPWRTNKLQAWSWLISVLLERLVKLIGIDSVAYLFLSRVSYNSSLLADQLFAEVLSKLLPKCIFLYFLR